MNAVLKNGLLAAVLLAFACSGNGGGGTGGGNGTGGDSSTGGGNSTGGGSGTGGSGTGGSGTGGSGVGGSAGGGTGGGSAGGSATGGGSSTGGGSGGGSSSTVKAGQITLTQYCFVAGGNVSCSASGLVLFYTATGGIAGTDCTQTTQGSCQVTACTATGDGGTPPSKTLDSAGDITITGTDAGIITMHFVSGYNPLSTGRLWAGGETITASAAGADVPAFSGKTVIAPNPITLTTPTCAPVGLSYDCGTIDRSTDYAMAWTGGALTTLVIDMTSTKGTYAAFIECKFTSSPGTIPAAALGTMGKTSDGFTNNITITAANTNTFTSGNYSVDLTASSFVVDGSFTASN